MQGASAVYSVRKLEISAEKDTSPVAIDNTAITGLYDQFNVRMADMATKTICSLAVGPSRYGPAGPFPI